MKYAGWDGVYARDALISRTEIYFIWAVVISLFKNIKIIFLSFGKF
jgi:hypothetical protein